MGMDELNAKLRYVFGDVVVRKDVVLYQEVARLPRSISEYLISSLGKENPERSDLEKIGRMVSEYYPEPKDRDKVLHDLMKTGEYKVIDAVQVLRCPAPESTPFCPQKSEIFAPPHSPLNSGFLFEKKADIPSARSFVEKRWAKRLDS